MIDLKLLIAHDVLQPVLHPQMKLQWIRSHWTPDKSMQARDWIIDAVSALSSLALIS